MKAGFAALNPRGALRGCPRTMLLAALLLVATAELACAQEAGPQGASPKAATVSVSARQLFDLADAAIASGDYEAAAKIYQVLEQDRDPQQRSEARFRHAMLLVRRGHYQAAALLLRRILDDAPDAQRVRLELARVLELMGDDAGARRALREAQAGGLPPDVARIVDLYSSALRARRPYGFNVEVALAPDSNINRATRSDSLDTVLGQFKLDEDARETSGIGLAIGGQAFARAPVSKDISFLARASIDADLYQAGRFDNVSLGVTLGPEIVVGRDRLNLEAGLTQHSFGGESYARTKRIGGTFLHPVGRRTQLRLNSSISWINNLFNELQDGSSYSLGATFEQALSSRAGLGFSANLRRDDLADPGYSFVDGRISLFGYREFGSLTIVPSVTLGKLKADERLAIYPLKRSDSFYQASTAISSRHLVMLGLAPLIRLTAERNASTVGIYNFNRFRGEFGFTRAF